ncbi:outer dense fiber protein 3-like protein 1 [Rhopalosiphum maidis]|uniref:outer dense fiber protein 3-like protein 1 n=1 Tax=Rhopalosiphum maidis TaxID=43146 RepID=UPI000EFF36CC|nr:outer dense fiber protein 3-like protein 1 [Rhopalosiphum maidis]
MGRKIMGCEPVAKFEIPGSTDPIGAECCKITEYPVVRTVLDCVEGAKPLKSVRMMGCYLEPRTAEGYIMDKKILDYTNSGSRSPGPAAYCVKTTIGPRATDPSIEKNPAYSMPGKKSKCVYVFGPGPMYNPTGVYRVGRDRVPGGPFGLRPPNGGPACGPSPADYCVKSSLSAAGHRIGPRPCPPNIARHCGPAPNAYSPSCRDCGLKTTLGKRLYPFKVCPTPGPGQYEIPPADLYMPGRFSSGKTIGRRFADKCKLEMPGPASYDSKRPKCCTRFTFGAKIPDTVPVFSVTADNQHFKC